MGQKYFHVGNVYKLMDDKTDSKIHNIKDYKNAKIHVEKLEALLKVINVSIKAFTLFEVYKASAECLSTLKNQKIMVEGYLNKCRRIIDSKGKV